MLNAKKLAHFSLKHAGFRNVSERSKRHPLIPLHSSTHVSELLEAVRADRQKAKAAKDTMDAPILFKSDIATYVRVYGLLSQIFAGEPKLNLGVG